MNIPELRQVVAIRRLIEQVPGRWEMVEGWAFGLDFDWWAVGLADGRVYARLSEHIRFAEPEPDELSDDEIRVITAEGAVSQNLWDEIARLKAERDELLAELEWRVSRAEEEWQDREAVELIDRIKAKAWGE